MEPYIDHDEGVRVISRPNGQFDYVPLQQDKRMTPDALRTAPSALGLSGRGLARVLDVNEKTWRRWVAGKVPIPRSVALAVQAMLDGWRPAA